jgi:deuterolysin
METDTITAAKAGFMGMLQRIATSSLSEDSFKSIGAGETIEVEIELAELYDLSKSGKYNVLAQGVIEYAEADSTTLSGTVLSYSSNKLDIDVDAVKTAKIETAIQRLSKRAAIQSDCTGTKLSAIRTALSNCNRLATAAATAATSGSASTFQTYFKTTSSSTRSTVAARLRAVASDCAAPSGGKTKTYCTDVYGGCESNVLAYTLPSQNYMAYCPIFFSQLPALSGQCHAQDQATTVLHEETHAPAVYSPGTQDNGYGYAAATSLTAARALANADSYALYANGMFFSLIYSLLKISLTDIVYSYLLWLLDGDLAWSNGRELDLCDDETRPGWNCVVGGTSKEPECSAHHTIAVVSNADRNVAVDPFPKQWLHTTKIVQPRRAFNKELAVLQVVMQPIMTSGSPSDQKDWA